MEKFAQKWILPGFVALVVGLMLFLGFFDPGSNVYKDLHPFTVVDLIGLILFMVFAVFISQVWKRWVDELWMERVNGVSIVMWICGALGILLIHVG